MNLNDTDFVLFAVPATFAQDRGALDARWKELQREAHPDRFAAQGGAAQRLAMQWSVRINEAYQRLKNPIKRATYLCQLNGAPIQAETNTAMPAAFLMQQMAWREELDDAQDAAAFEKLRAEVEAARARALSSLDWLIDEKGDYAEAARQVRALMFIERFAEDIEAKVDQ
ncbi:Fe-S protein assembly co-chaperone HscB [Variovorax sp. J31P179]|uniref:Fe-S protein assembly co-chaperone HscB n=1 Tax=Variovorax sp. J31P179 TaxID=3053508 RepID=UPI002577D989|nr:Fe-S protein assembly co-chaperone HscB [Variovorax sp. J31P179]MDM0081018.1 Fe-S protein assembly co-chaperone HscB [Variovorax sp. J31P179]